MQFSTLGSRHSRATGTGRISSRFTRARSRGPSHATGASRQKPNKLSQFLHRKSKRHSPNQSQSTLKGDDSEVTLLTPSQEILYGRANTAVDEMRAQAGQATASRFGIGGRRYPELSPTCGGAGSRITYAPVQPFQNPVSRQSMAPRGPQESFADYRQRVQTIHECEQLVAKILSAYAASVNPGDDATACHPNLLSMGGRSLANQTPQTSVIILVVEPGPSNHTAVPSNFSAVPSQYPGRYQPAPGRAETLYEGDSGQGSPVRRIIHGGSVLDRRTNQSAPPSRTDEWLDDQTQYSGLPVPDQSAVSRAPLEARRYGIPSAMATGGGSMYMPQQKTFGTLRRVGFRV